jgi:hypothetical protein
MDSGGGAPRVERAPYTAAGNLDKSRAAAVLDRPIFTGKFYKLSFRPGTGS